MAYRKNGQYTKYRKNSNYNNRKDNRYNDNRINDNRMSQPVLCTFDATKYRKPNIRIVDINYKEYYIPGDFTADFVSELMQLQTQIDKIKKGNPIEKFPEILILLKEWCLKLINLNVDGIKYEMADVNKGFNNILLLSDLIKTIAAVVSGTKIDENNGIEINEHSGQ